MPAEPPAWIRSALSLPRFIPYIRTAGGDIDTAVRLYWWNIEISSAFYGPLHCLELGLRNALHQRLLAHYRRPDWWAAAPLSPAGARMVADAEAKLRRRGPAGGTADDVVAGLSFGFWVALLSRGAAYDRSFWVPALHRAFPGYSGPRSTLHDNLLAMVFLRNRIMHHEPIHHRDLRADHQKVYRILGYLSPELAVLARTLDRVPAALGHRAEVCRGSRPACF
jgi:hypothetical protein